MVIAVVVRTVGEPKETYDLARHRTPNGTFGLVVRVLGTNHQTDHGTRLMDGWLLISLANRPSVPGGRQRRKQPSCHNVHRKVL